MTEFQQSTTPTTDGVHILPPPPRLSPDQVREWVRKAKPRAKLRYGRGSHVSFACSGAVDGIVKLLIELGYVVPVQDRKTCPRFDGLDYWIIRTEKPVLTADAF